MTKILPRQLPPSESPDHLALHNLVKRNNHSAIVSRKICWLINAYSRLVSFHQVASNLSDTLDFLVSSAGVSLQKYGIEEWPQLLRWLKANKHLLDQLGGGFTTTIDPDSPTERENKALTRHGLYFLLIVVHDLPGYQKHYSLLVGHLLLAHIQAVMRFIPFGTYGSYTGEPEILDSYRKVYSATLTMRRLSRAGYLDALKKLNPYQGLDAFKDYLENLDIDKKDPARNYINNYRRYILHNTEPEQKRSSSSYSTGAKRVNFDWGNIGYLSTPTVKPIILGDPQDPMSDWGGQYSVPDYPDQVNLHPDSKEELSQDVHPDEVSNGDELTLTNYSCSKHKKGMAQIVLAARGQARQKKLANQLFSWSYDVLTTSEMVSLFHELESQFTMLKKKKNWTSSDVTLAETITLASISFWFGQDLEITKELQIIAGDRVDCKLGVWRYKSTKDGKIYTQWRIESYTPELKKSDDNYESTKEHCREWKQFVFLPDNARVGEKLFYLYEKLLASRNITNFSGLFSLEAETYKKKLKELITQFSSDGRITIHKIQTYLFRKIVCLTGDVCAASAITGRQHWLTFVRAHYYSPSIEYLQGIYSEFVDQALHTYNQIYPKNTLSFMPVQHIERFAKDQVCRPSCPMSYSVKNMIAELTEKISQHGQLDKLKNFSDYHNNYTMYTTVLYKYTTGLRAIVNPLRSAMFVDTIERFTIVADKDNEDRSKGRPAWIPDFVYEHLMEYKKHCAAFLASPLSSKIQAKKGQCLSGLFQAYGGFFILNSKAIEIRPKYFSKHIEELLPLPANVHRKFFKTLLSELGFPQEVIDAWLGHWNIGQEPYGRYSTFSFPKFREFMKKNLVPFLDELGFVKIDSTLPPRETSDFSNN